MATQKNGLQTFTAGEALEQYRQVKLHSSTNQVVYADAGEAGIGFTTAAAASGASVTVRLIHTCGNHVGVAGEALAWGDAIYSGADGKLVNDVSGVQLGLCTLAADGDGDIIEFVLIK